MSPSVSEKRRFGKRHQKSAHMRSPREYVDMTDDRLMPTDGGASAVVEADFEDDPTWQHSTVPSSEHAAKRGSQWPEWIEGMWSAAGFSENVTAWHPFAARRRTSAAALSTSKSGRMPQGMKRSGWAAHHSSTCQSLYALIMISFTAGSGPSLST